MYNVTEHQDGDVISIVDDICNLLTHVDIHPMGLKESALSVDNTQIQIVVYRSPNIPLHAFTNILSSILTKSLLS